VKAGFLGELTDDAEPPELETVVDLEQIAEVEF
jgi:hypothetical protein